METSPEACWRLSKACGQWAVESRDTNVYLKGLPVAAAYVVIH